VIKRIKSSALAAAGLLAVCAGFPAASQVPAAPPAQAPAPSPAAPAPSAAAAAPGGETLTLMQTVCANCHELSVVTDQRKSRDEWNTTVNTMIAHGAPLTDAQADEIVAYLAKNYAIGK
jgi:cytochrome c5